MCRLCTEGALARGWRREGAPNPPPAAYTRGPEPAAAAARKRAGAARRWRCRTPAQDAARRAAARAAPGEARVRAAEDAVAAGVELFNGSAYRRTVSGIAKSLGRPRVSVLPLGGIRPDVVVTVAWDISWYQYRVDADASPAVRLEGRGDDLQELDPRWRAWNASAADDGSVVIEGVET